MKDLPIEKRIGVSTHFMPATHGEDIWVAISIAGELGFTGFEIVPSLDQGFIGFPHNAYNVGVDLWDMSDAESGRLIKKLSEFEWVTVHSPHLGWNLASANRHLRKLTWQYYDCCFELAAELEAAAMTFHGGYETWGIVRPASEIYEYNLEYAQHLMEKAKKANVPVGYEITQNFECLKYVCHRLPGWGINLDMGHAYMERKTDERYYKYFDEFGDRILEVHQNSVCHYWNGFIEHLAVNTNNTIDYQGTYERLKSLNYKGPIVCEIGGLDIQQAMQNCQQAKEMICGLWKGDLQLKNRWYNGK